MVVALGHFSRAWNFYSTAASSMRGSRFISTSWEWYLYSKDGLFLYFVFIFLWLFSVLTFNSLTYPSLWYDTEHWSFTFEFCSQDWIFHKKPCSVCLFSSLIAGLLVQPLSQFSTSDFVKYIASLVVEFMFWVPFRCLIYIFCDSTWIEFIFFSRLGPPPPNPGMYSWYWLYMKLGSSFWSKWFKCRGGPHRNLTLTAACVFSVSWLNFRFSLLLI